MSFSGAKLALFLGADLLVILRDDFREIPYPAHWDMPGGGREGQETPEECVLRETREEVGLIVAPSRLVWARQYKRPHGLVWLFATHLPKEAAGQIRFGSEGQEWRLMSPEQYCAHPKAVPHFPGQLRDYLADSQYRKNITD